MQAEGVEPIDSNLCFDTGTTTCCIMIISLADLYSILLIMWLSQWPLLFNYIHIQRIADCKLLLWKVLLKVFFGAAVAYQSTVLQAGAHCTSWAETHFRLFCHFDVTE